MSNTATMPVRVGQQSIDLGSVQPATRRPRRRAEGGSRGDRRGSTSRFRLTGRRPEPSRLRGRRRSSLDVSASLPRRLEPAHDPIPERIAPAWTPEPATVVRTDADPELANNLIPLGGPSQVALDRNGQLIESGFKNVVCMTLYNEPFELFRNSLSALLASLDAQRLARRRRGRRDPASSSSPTGAIASIRTY